MRPDAGGRACDGLQLYRIGIGEHDDRLALFRLLLPHICFEAVPPPRPACLPVSTEEAPILARLTGFGEAKKMQQRRTGFCITSKPYFKTQS